MIVAKVVRIIPILIIPVRCYIIDKIILEVIRIIIIIMATRFIDFKNRTEYNIHEVVVPTRGEEFQYRTLVVVNI